jgi:hypothetical protein
MKALRFSLATPAVDEATDGVGDEATFCGNPSLRQPLFSSDKSRETAELVSALALEASSRGMPGVARGEVEVSQVSMASADIGSRFYTIVGFGASEKEWILTKLR